MGIKVKAQTSGIVFLPLPFFILLFSSDTSGNQDKSVWMTTTGRKRNAGRQTELSETVSERVEESKQSQMGRFVANHEALYSLS